MTLIDDLICPNCLAQGREQPLCVRAEGGLFCRSCGAEYAFADKGPARLMADSVGATKQQIAAFWGDLCRQLYSANDTLGPAEIRQQLTLLEDYFRRQSHLAVTEMDLKSLAGKTMLEIGSGGGGHSALFRSYGARVIAMDITPERVAATHQLLGKVERNPDDFICLNADAETIPIRSDSLNLVYSNGVLHHSAQTDKCIEEVHRILKPGGRAVLMLYCRSSALFYSLLFWRGLLNGARFRAPEEVWLGHITEGRPKYQSAYNPITRVYSRAELGKLLEKFEIVSIRKSSFEFGQVLPFGAGILNKLLQRLFGNRKHPGGQLVYGEPGNVSYWPERVLGRYLGFDWNIVVRKR